METVQTLAERANIQLPTLENTGDSLKEELKAKVYKENEFTRQFYHETLKSFRIGFSGKFDELYQELKKQGFEEKEILESGLVNKNERGQYIDRYRNRLMFPICDARGRVIAFGGRVLDDSKPKYINSPENIVYSKGRNLFGLNVAKKGDTKKLLIVEGYMDVVSLHQRGITNVVAPLGTALTEQQGWLLRKSAEQIILSFDSDGAGLQAKLRALDILQNMGCDLRVLQIDGAKDPDEYIVKYGNVRFQNLVEKAQSIIEFKVKVLKKDLNLENVNDKIKFLNEIAKLIAKVDNNIEKEIYIEKIAKEYEISKEAIYAEVNKITYKNTKNEKILEKSKPVLIHKKKEIKEVSENIKPDDFQHEINHKIAEKLYEEFEKGNSNINGIIDELEEDEQNQITEIMAEDYEINDIEKAIDDIMQIYEKEKLNNRKFEILELLEQNTNTEEKKKLEKELTDIIIRLAKIK